MTNQNVDLKRAGLKVTLPRLNILSILSESADEGAHLSAEDVYQRLRDAGDDENRFFLRRLGIKPEGVVCNSEFLQQKTLVCDLQAWPSFQSHLHLF